MKIAVVNYYAVGLIIMIPRFLITGFILASFPLFIWIAPIKNFLVSEPAETPPSIEIGEENNNRLTPEIIKEEIEQIKILPVIENKNKSQEIIEGLDLTSRAAAVIDINKQQARYQKNAEQKFPIASLTKLMTAIIFFELNIDLKKEVVFSEADNNDIKKYFLPGESTGKLYLTPGDKIKVKDLLYSSLVGSSNNATIALARSTGLPREMFIKRMNERARTLGLENTVFKEPTGLDSGNVSTALDISRLAEYAFGNEQIRKITTTPKYSFQISETKNWHTVINTNWLVGNLPGLYGSKTGYTGEAGDCIVVGIENNDKNFIIALFGAKDSAAKFKELEEVAIWAQK